VFEFPLHLSSSLQLNVPSHRDGEEGLIPARNLMRPSSSRQQISGNESINQPSQSKKAAQPGESKRHR